MRTKEKGFFTPAVKILGYTSSAVCEGNWKHGPRELGNSALLAEALKKRRLRRP